MSIILMTTLFYKALILQGEIWCWSLLGLKGLTRLQCQDWGHRAGSENQILPKTKLNSGHLRIAYSGYSTTIPYESVEEEERGTFFAPNGNSEKVRAPYGIQPTTLRDLVGCSNHWATGYSIKSSHIVKPGQARMAHNCIMQSHKGIS